MSLTDFANSASPQSRPNLRQRILVAEDDRFIRRLNAEVLIDSGYEVNAVEDGAGAWGALQVDNFDLLITDNGMPKVTGIELVKKIHSARLALPVIMATGAVPQQEFGRHPWLQINAVLLKPYTPDELLGAVREVLFAPAAIVNIGPDQAG